MPASSHVVRAILAYHLVGLAKDLLNQPQPKWVCRRCGEDVDTVAMRCKCTTSPYPWELVNYEH